MSKDANEAVKELAEQTSQAYNTAIEDSKAMNEQLFMIMREHAKEELELKSHLTRILTRMEEKLDQPLRCPAAIQSRKGEPDGQ